MLLLVDNYDSFTYNLYQYLCELGQEVRVVRNDGATLDEIASWEPAFLVISPGPGDPSQAGISLDLIGHFAGKIPILGVCLGHQCIGARYGGRVVRAGEIKHGKMSPIHHDGGSIFAGLPNPFPAIRYHSLVVERDSVPACLEVSAWTEKGLVMGLRHRSLPVEGVQFHPESIMTEHGKKLLANFLSCCG